METEKAYILSDIIKGRQDHLASLCAAYEKRTGVDPRRAMLVERKTDNSVEWFFRDTPEWDDPILRSNAKCGSGHVTMLSNQYCPTCHQEQLQNLKTQYIGALELLEATQFGFSRVENGICIFCQGRKADGHTKDCPMGKFLESVK